MVIKTGDTIVIEDELVFKVMETLEYDGVPYIYGFEAPKEIIDAIDPQDFEKSFLQEKVNIQTEEVFVEEIEDKDLIGKLKQELINRLQLEREV